MPVRLSVIAVVAAYVVSVLSCGGETATAPPDGFSHTKVPVTLDTLKTYFKVDWLESGDIKVDFSGDAISFVGYFEKEGSIAKHPLAMVSYIESPSGIVLRDASKLRALNEAHPARRPVAGAMVNADGSVSEDATAVIFWPVADDVEPERGIYTVRVAILKPASATPPSDGTDNSALVETDPEADSMTGNFHVIVRRGEKTDEGTLDVNLFYVDGSGVSTANDAPVAAALDEFFRLLAPHKISRGQVSVFDIKSSKFDAVDLSQTDSNSAVNTITLEAKQAANKRAVNLFFVRELLPEGAYLGVSKGIPVGLGVGESRHAGILMNLSAFQSETDVSGYSVASMGRVMLHEAGHAIGLFHTTEQLIGSGGFTAHDLIIDTPECPAGADRDGNGALSAFECLDFDARNLMFPSAGYLSVVSTGQGYVFRHSVVVKGKARAQ